MMQRKEINLIMAGNNGRSLFRESLEMPTDKAPVKDAQYDIDSHIKTLDFKMLRWAVAGITDNWMSSKDHHPGWVLIPEDRFVKLRVADRIMRLREGHDTATLSSVEPVSSYQSGDAVYEIEWLAGLAKKAVATDEEREGIDKAVTLIFSVFPPAATNAPVEPAGNGREVYEIVGRIPVSEFPGKTFRERQDNAAKVLAALSSPSERMVNVSAGELTKAMDPDLFSDDPKLRHVAASPYDVAGAQQIALNKAQGIINRLNSGWPNENTPA